MFFPKAVVLALLPFAVVSALPQPERRAPRPDLGDFVGSLFDGATSEVGSAFSHATSVVGSAVDAASSIVESALEQATASSIFSEVTSQLGTSTSQVFATIVTTNGVPVVAVTSSGGPAITLATQSGMTTSFAGHTFTIATATPTSPSSSSSSTSTSSTSSSTSATSTHNAAMSVRPMAFSGNMVWGAVSVVGSVVAGAMLVL